MRPVFRGFIIVLLSVGVHLPPANAFPPAPDLLIYGMAKDQYGTPLLNPADMVVLQTPSGVKVSANIQPGLAVGINYSLSVPMDAGVTSDPYLPNALMAAAQYTLYVVVGNSTNLPIEMVQANSVLPGPGQQIRQDLTLGADSNGDGIPDAWELVFLQEIGATNTLASLTANTMLGGLTVRQQYLLGNYPFNPTNVFSVQLLSQSNGSAVLGFTTMLGRTYSAYGSTDLRNWTLISFTIPARSATATAQTFYYAPNIQPLQIQTVQPTNTPTMQFFRLQLQ
jgi:hypothetical protein